MKREYQDSLIIHGFALLHAAAAVLCRMWNVSDELILTILTMTLSLLLCLKYNEGVEFTAISIILVNVLGYLLGTGIVPLVKLVVDHPLLSPALSTFFTTELMGWGLVYFIRLYADRAGKPKAASRTETKYLVGAILAVFIVRILITTIFGSDAFTGDSIKESVSAFGQNTILLFALVGLTILFIQYYKKNSEALSVFDKVLFTVLFILVSSGLMAFLACMGFSFSNDTHFSTEMLAEMFIVALIFEAMIYSVIYMVDYAINARRNAERERDKANLAKFQYLNLKQQVNPHFLFNSLNILDALVLDGKDQQASTYIHKLAGTYRYMLRSEDKPLASLRDEMTFVDMYTDLLKVRFQDGFIIEKDIREEDMNAYVIPCSIQLLIENATKHNAVSEEKPLRIRISSDGETIVVTNNLIPKVSKSPSNGLGLNYLRQQYSDRASKEIEIIQTDESYTVKLPLI